MWRGAGERDLGLERCALVGLVMLDGLVGGGPECRMVGMMTRKRRVEYSILAANFVTPVNFSIAFERKKI